MLYINNRLRKWLRELVPPVALFASHDNQGFQITEACREENIRVPEEAAVVGVDNDNVLCNLSSPPLSSIILPSRRMLERKFLASFDRGVAQEIRRVHVERAKGMLSESELSMVAVARNCGFTSGKHLSTVIQQEEGIPPTEYRRLNRNRVI